MLTNPPSQAVENDAGRPLRMTGTGSILVHAMETTTVCLFCTLARPECRLDDNIPLCYLFFFTTKMHIPVRMVTLPLEAGVAATIVDSLACIRLIHLG